MWDIVRATGIIAWIALTASVAVGTIFSGRLLPPKTQKTVLSLHRSTSWLAMAFLVLHGGSPLLAEQPWRLRETLIPFAVAESPLSVALGIVAAYAMLATIASFYLRHRLGARAWRRIHMASYVAFVGGWIHGVTMGTDTASPLMRGIYIGSFVLILLLTVQRAVAATAPVPATRAAVITNNRRMP